MSASLRLTSGRRSDPVVDRVRRRQRRQRRRDVRLLAAPVEMEIRDQGSFAIERPLRLRCQNT